MLAALIFDLDGTLADTEETHRQAFNAAFIEFALWWDWSPPLYASLLRISGGKERLRHYIGTLRVSAAERERLLANVDALLQANLGAARDMAFDVIACGDVVPEKKPAPDIYRLALSSLRLPSDACIAFEDSLNGLRAAKAAGLVTVVTPSRWTAEEDFSGADLLLPSLEGLELDRLAALLGETHAST